MRLVLLALIRFYQRCVSPYKGFQCAYRVHTGRASCSALGYRAVQRFGVFKGLGLIRQRTHLCGVGHRRYRPVCHHAFPRTSDAARWPGFVVPHQQRGDCDVGCVDVSACEGCPQGCTPHCADLDVCELASNGLDCLDCADCGCDLWERWRKRHDEAQGDKAAAEERIHLPPQRQR